LGVHLHAFPPFTEAAMSLPPAYQFTPADVGSVAQTITRALQDGVVNNAIGFIQNMEEAADAGVTAASAVSSAVSSAGSAAGAASRAIPFVGQLRTLAKMSAVLGVAGAALDIFMMFQPSDTDQILDAIDRMGDRIDRLGDRLSAQIGDLQNEVVKQVYLASLTDARATIAHAVEVMRAFEAGYGQLNTGFLTADNVIRQIVLVNSAGNQVIYPTPSSVTIGTMAGTDNWQVAKGIRAMPTFFGATNRTAQDLPLKDGTNTLYVQVENTGGPGGFLASFTTFERAADGSGLVRTYSTSTDTNGASPAAPIWQLLVSNPAIDFATMQAQSASDWVAPTDYGAYGAGPWGDAVAGMPDTTAHWIWAANADASHAWVRVTFQYSAAAHADAEQYFGAVARANVMNFDTDRLANAVFQLIQVATNYDGSLSEGVLDQVAAQCQSDPWTITLTANHLFQRVMQGIKALTFMRSIKAQQACLAQYGASHFASLTADQQADLRKRMYFAETGVSEMFCNPRPGLGLVDAFASKVQALLAPSQDWSQFSRIITGVIERIAAQSCGNGQEVVDLVEGLQALYPSFAWFACSRDLSTSTQFQVVQTLPHYLYFTDLVPGRAVYVGFKNRDEPLLSSAATAAWLGSTFRTTTDMAALASAVESQFGSIKGFALIANDLAQDFGLHATDTWRRSGSPNGMAHLYSGGYTSGRNNRYIEIFG
jgi:hypothetical protein